MPCLFPASTATHACPTRLVFIINSAAHTSSRSALLAEKIQRWKGRKMGQSMKLPKGKDDDAKTKEIIEKITDEKFRTMKDRTLEMADFYHEICHAVQEMNVALGSGVQFRLPTKDEFKTAFDKHHKGRETLSKSQFEAIIKDVIFKTGFIGKGAKDLLLYIFGLPVSALLVKQGLFPNVVSDEVLIPAVTSASVFLLARMKKL